jgi:hypothetical protein
LTNFTKISKIITKYILQESALENLLDNFSVNQAQFLMDAIQSAIEYNQAKESQFNTISHNGRSGTFWDLLNTNVNAIPSTEFSCNLQRLGSWGILFIREPKSGVVFTLMKKKRIESLRKMDSDLLPKYLHSSILKNTPQKFKGRQQEFDLFSSSEENHENEYAFAEQKFDNDTFGFYGQSVTQYGIVIFDIDGERVSYLQAIIPNLDLEPIYSKDLLKETKAEMPVIVSSSKKEETIGLKLRDKAKEHKQSRMQTVPERIVDSEMPIMDSNQ